MFLILPDQVDPGIRDLELNITTNLIKELMATLQVQTPPGVEMFCPRVSTAERVAESGEFD